MLTNTCECLAIILRSLRLVANCIRKPIRLIFATFWRICREYIFLHSQGYSPQCESSIKDVLSVIAIVLLLYWRLTHRITPAEINQAIGKLNNGRASGHDDIPAELFKCSADLLAQPIANIFNDALEHHEPLGLGKGVLILIQKPGKPKGSLTSVRPIVLLTTLRKTLSLVVLSRIAPKVDDYLSPSQSGFRRGRSTADVLFGYRWLSAKAQRQRVSIEFLGIDLSRAFDTIRRDKLLDTLQTFLGESEMRMIRLLLADTSLEPRLSTGDCHAFATSIGTPQGDSLIPVLFTVYLEAALRDLRSRLPTRPLADANLPLDVEYADDTDFISTSRPFLDDIERIAPACLAEFVAHHQCVQNGAIECLPACRPSRRGVAHDAQARIAARGG